MRQSNAERNRMPTRENPKMNRSTIYIILTFQLSHSFSHFPTCLRYAKRLYVRNQKYLVLEHTHKPAAHADVQEVCRRSAVEGLLLFSKRVLLPLMLLCHMFECACRGSQRNTNAYTTCVAQLQVTHVCASHVGYPWRTDS